MTDPEAPGAAANPIPWEDAGQSRVQGLFRTLGQVLFHPREFCQSLSLLGWLVAGLWTLFLIYRGLGGARDCLPGRP